MTEETQSPDAAVVERVAAELSPIEDCPRFRDAELPVPCSLSCGCVEIAQRALSALKPGDELGGGLFVHDDFFTLNETIKHVRAADKRQARREISDAISALEIEQQE